MDTNSLNPVKSVARPPKKIIPPIESKTEVPKANPNSFFKAVGIIEGDINFPEAKEVFPTIKVEGKDYRLMTIPTAKGYRAIIALKAQVLANGTRQKLIVYPRILHLPQKEIVHTISFCLIGFIGKKTGSEDQKNLLWDILEVNEFYISGLFQRIPVCRNPVITIFKNLTNERIEFIKKANAIERASFMRPNHVPVNYPSPIVPPFQFVKPQKFSVSDKQIQEKDPQNVKFFIEIKAIFNSNRDLFVFDNLISMPQEIAPKYLHISKKDKQQAVFDKKRLRAQNNSLTKEPKNKSFVPPKKKETND